MICCSLSSGSNGNCIYVEAGGARLLFDAGISGRQTAARLAGIGRSARDVDAVIISHEHADHAGCAGVLSRKLSLPVYMTRRTHLAASRYGGLGPIADLRHFDPDGEISFAGATVKPVRTPHDGADPVAFVVVAAEGRRLGILTDLGCVFAGLREIVGGLDAAVLESNYDPAMLAAGPYPRALKDRIAGPHGHLSNPEAAELVRSAADGRLQWVMLAHLSQTNNTPALALRTHLDIVGRRRPVHLAGRYAPGKLLRVE